MILECSQDGDGVSVGLRLSAADLPRLDAVFQAVRSLLEIGASRAPAPCVVESPAASTGDMPEGREHSGGEADATAPVYPADWPAAIEGV
jgi:hypothetical protein